MFSALRTKRLLWGVIFALLSIMSWLSYSNGQRYLRAASSVEHTMRVQGIIDGTIGAVQEAEDTERGFLLTEDPSQLEACRIAQRSVPHRLAELSELTRDNPAQQRRILELRGFIADKLEFIDDKLNLMLTGNRTSAIALIRSGRGIVLMNQIRAIGAAMGAEERRLLETRKLEAERAQKAAAWGIGIGSALTLGLSLFSFLSVHRDVRELRHAAEELAQQAEQLRSLSLTDELTSLYNRRGWLELSRQALRIAAREQRTAAVIFADLNGMKQINDQHGHDEGDRALKDTADVLRKACREVDVLARFGGDEFVVFALDFDEAGLEALRARARGVIARINQSGERPFFLSLSLGAAFFRPDRQESLEELLDRADAEMYERKRARKARGGVSLPPPAES